MAHLTFDGRAQTRFPSTPNPQFFRCLPLQNKNRYAKGMTVYISDEGIVGLEAHFDNHSQISGLRRGCAFYYQFHATEQIAYVWIHVPHENLRTILASAIQVSQ
jgi:hypothetical protein